MGTICLNLVVLNKLRKAWDQLLVFVLARYPYYRESSKKRLKSD